MLPLEPLRRPCGEPLGESLGSERRCPVISRFRSFDSHLEERVDPQAGVQCFLGDEVVPCPERRDLALPGRVVDEELVVVVEKLPLCTVD